MKTLRTFIIIISLLSFKFSQAQHHFTYEYDDAGNRTQRMYHIMRIGGAQPDTLSKENISGHEVKIYPNPTTGSLTVNIADFSNVGQSKIEMYDISGRQVFKKETLSEYTNLDLTNNKSGDYFLRIYLDGKMKEWKVMKAY